ncbi:MAG TPA: hypothetical protein VN770_04980 [Gaiellaceae bacterium]|nr:hypothetical protein [Gaiellaceae bacterium]
MPVSFDGSLDGIDWAQAKADLAADRFDNGSRVVGMWLDNHANR